MPPALPPIPEIPAELVEPLKALARSAHIMRGVFVQAGRGKSVREIILERGETLETAEQVIDFWRAHLGIEDDPA